MTFTLKLVVTSLVFAGLSACASTQLPESKSNMAEIYAGNAANVRPNSGASARPLNSGGADLAGFTRSAASELSTRFPKVPNPTLVMFVYPHLAGAMPVPGFVTTFPMWESAPYALPGETPEVTDEVLP